MLMQRDGCGIREMGRFLKRSASTVSRELDRDLGAGLDYVASQAGEHAHSLRRKPRKALKLVAGNPLFEIVKGHLKNKWSPEQIAGTLKAMHPDQPARRVSHETIYHTLYAMPRGELRRELIACLRWSRDKRRSVLIKCTERRSTLAKQTRFDATSPGARLAGSLWSSFATVGNLC